jgi:hypothetical protein
MQQEIVHGQAEAQVYLSIEHSNTISTSGIIPLFEPVYGVQARVNEQFSYVASYSDED